VQREVARMIALLQVYIHIRKGVEIDVQPPKNTRQLRLLRVMHRIANEWMVKMKYQTNQI